jgi:hypothetical protein
MALAWAAAISAKKTGKAFMRSRWRLKRERLKNQRRLTQSCPARLRH